MEKISSVKNERVKGLVRLGRGSERRKLGVFLVETRRELGRAMDGGFEVLEVYVCGDEMMGDEVVGRAEDGGVEVIEITENVLKKVAYRENPEGLIGVVKSRVMGLGDLGDEVGDGGIGGGVGVGVYVVCSGLEKPGNVGAILRTAEAAGVDCVMFDREVVDLFNPNCVRASTGAVFGLKLVCAEQGELIEWLRGNGVKIVASVVGAEKDYTEADMRGNVALVVGSEAEGLDEVWRREADLCVSIAMRGSVVDSLNVSVSAGLLIYEAVRQRGLKGNGDD